MLLFLSLVTAQLATSDQAGASACFLRCSPGAAGACFFFFGLSTPAFSAAFVSVPFLVASLMARPPRIVLEVRPTWASPSPFLCAPEYALECCALCTSHRQPRPCILSAGHTARPLAFWDRSYEAWQRYRTGWSTPRGVRDRILRGTKVTSSNALMPLYPSALILRIFVYLLTSINFAGPSNAHNDETANSRAFHSAKSRLKRSLFGGDIWGSVNFTKILAARQLRPSIGTDLIFRN